MHSWQWPSRKMRSKVKLCWKFGLKTLKIKLFLSSFSYCCYMKFFLTLTVLGSLINGFENEIMFFSQLFEQNPKNDVFQNGHPASDEILLTNVTFEIFDITMPCDISNWWVLFQLSQWICYKYWLGHNFGEKRGQMSNNGKIGLQTYLLTVL